MPSELFNNVKNANWVKTNSDTLELRGDLANTLNPAEFAILFLQSPDLKSRINVHRDRLPSGDWVVTIRGRLKLDALKDAGFNITEAPTEASPVR